MSRRSREAARRSAAGLTRHRWDASLGMATDRAPGGRAPGRPADDGGRPADAAPGGRAPGRGAPGRGAPERPADDGGQPADAAPSSTERARRPPAAALRWRTGRRAAALVAVVSVLLSGWFWWQAAAGAPRSQPLGGPPGAEHGAGAGDVPSTAEAGMEGAAPEDAATQAAGTDAGSPDAGGTAEAGVILVHVAGAVARPGVVELPRGSRLHEAIRAAGGSTPGADLDRLNLAAVLADEQKVLVPKLGDPDPPPGAGEGSGGGDSGAAPPAGTAPPGGKINLNAAGVEELATLPRVGPVLAQRIVDWRREHGNFGSPAELDAVEGIGPKLLAALLPLVEV